MEPVPQTERSTGPEVKWRPRVLQVAVLVDRETMPRSSVEKKEQSRTCILWSRVCKMILVCVCLCV